MTDVWRPPGWTPAPPSTAAAVQPSTASTDPERCGTYRGAQAHRKRGEKPCDPCKAAQNAYVKQWRTRNAERAAELHRDQNARDRALRALARRHPGEFDQLYQAEKTVARDNQPQPKDGTNP